VDTVWEREEEEWSEAGRVVIFIFLSGWGPLATALGSRDLE
jgi:hypothetical protein